MFNFLKWFKSSTPDVVKPKVPNFPLGAMPNEPDVRDITFTAVYPLVQVTDDAYLTDVTMLGELYQILGTCVAHAYVFIGMFQSYLETGIVTKYMVRFLYALTRIYEGDSSTSLDQGLQARQAAKVFVVSGLPPTSALDDETLPHSKYVNDFATTPQMLTDANKARAGGYAFPLLTVADLKHALKITKIVGITVIIDWNKLEVNGTLHAPVTVAGTHEIDIIGWDTVGGGRFIAKNWWLGYEHLYIPFSEMSAIICDAITFVDIPDDLIARAKATPYVFVTTLDIGSTGIAVTKLQQRLIDMNLLNIAEPSGYFGGLTATAVRDYQKLKGLQQVGVFGPQTRLAMNTDAGNGNTPSKIDLWVAAATIMEGAIPSINNPGNLKDGQYTRSMGSTGVHNGFAVFPTEALGYAALRNLFVAACTGQSARYPSDLTLYEFYAGKTLPDGTRLGGYAPESDGNMPNHYAEVMAKAMGVDPSLQIKNLV